MSDVTVAVTPEPDPPVVAVPVVTDDDIAGDLVRTLVAELHAERQMRLSEMADRHESHVRACDERIATLEARIATLEGNPHESPSAEAREEALDELATVGEVVADVVEAVEGPPDEQAPPSTPPGPSHDGSPEGTIVAPDGEESDEGGDTSGPTEPTRRTRRRGGLW